MSEGLLLLLGSVAVFGAAFVQGVTGFGHALVAIGFLTVLFGAKEAVLVLTLVAPVISLAYFLRVRRHVDLRELLAIALPLCLVGLPLGILLFDAIDAELLNRVVGALLVASALYFLSPLAPRPRRIPLPVTAVAGTLSGFLAGLTSTGGPPLVLYLYAREMEKERRMAVLQAVFLVGSAVKVVQVAAAGLFTPSSLTRAAWLSPSILLGVLLGAALMPRIPAARLRQAALLLLLAVGVVLFTIRV